MTNNKLQVYWLLSGEGELGDWKRVETSPRGIKLRLTRERCRGERWAHAFETPFETKDGCVAGYDVDDGRCRTLPDDARLDISK